MVDTTLRIDIETHARKTGELRDLQKRINNLKKSLQGMPDKIKTPKVAAGFDKDLTAGLKRRFGAGFEKVTQAEKKRWKELAKTPDEAIKKYQAAVNSVAGFGRALQRLKKEGKDARLLDWGKAQASLRMVRQLEHAIGKYHQEYLAGQKQISNIERDAASRARGLANLGDRIRRKRAAEEERITGKRTKDSERAARDQARHEEYKSSFIRHTNDLYERQRRIKDSLGKVKRLRRDSSAAGDIDRVQRLMRIENRLKNRLAANGAVIHNREMGQRDAKLNAMHREANEANKAFNANRKRLFRLQDIQRRVADRENANFDKIERAKLALYRKRQTEMGRIRQGGMKTLGQAGGSFNRGVNSLTNPFFESPVFYMTAAGTAAGVAMAKAFTEFMSTQKAETDAAVFGLATGDFGADMKRMGEIRKNFLDEKAIRNALSPSEAIGAYAEVLRAGLPDGPIAELAFNEASNAKLSMGQDLAEGIRVVSRSATIAKAEKGQYEPEKIKEVQSALFLGAQKTGASSPETVSAMRRGLAAVSFGMSEKTAIGLMTAGISAGLPAFQAGNALQSGMGDLIGATQFIHRDRRSRREVVDSRGEEIVRGARATGLIAKKPETAQVTARELKQVQKLFADDADGAIMKALEGLNKLKPSDRALAANRLFNKEHADAFTVMATGVKSGIYQQFIDAFEEDKGNGFKAASEGAKRMRETASNLWSSIGVGIQFALADLGSGFEGPFKDFATKFIDWIVHYRDLRLGERASAAFNGFFGGMGIDLTSVWDRIFMRFRTSDDTIEQIGDFFWGFGEGLKEMFAPLKQIWQQIMGIGFDARQIGTMIGQAIGFLLMFKLFRPLIGMGSFFVNMGFAAGRMLTAIGTMGKLATKAGAALPSLAASTILANKGLSKIKLGTIKGLALRNIGSVFGFLGRGLWLGLGLEIIDALVNNWSTIKPMLKAAAQKIFGVEFKLDFGQIITDGIAELKYQLIEEIRRELSNAFRAMGLNTPDWAKAHNRDGSLMSDEQAAQARKDAQLFNGNPGKIATMLGANQYGEKGMGNILPALPDWARLSSTMWEMPKTQGLFAEQNAKGMGSVLPALPDWARLPYWFNRLTTSPPTPATGASGPQAMIPLKGLMAQTKQATMIPGLDRWLNTPAPQATVPEVPKIEAPKVTVPNVSVPALPDVFVPVPPAPKIEVPGRQSLLPSGLDTLTGSSGTEQLAGSAGNDAIMAASVSYQADSSEKLTAISRSMDDLLRLFRFEDIGAGSGGGGGGGGGGYNGSIRYGNRGSDGSVAQAVLPKALQDQPNNGYASGSFGGDPYSGGAAEAAAAINGKSQAIVGQFSKNSPMEQRRSQLMAVAMDELRKQGVPEANLKGAAAMLVGQAQSESGLDPTKSHDGGTGYGLYGARLGRRSAMWKWMAENGYANDSAEGQMRYMAREAMSGRYKNSKDILMQGRTDGGAVHEFTREFESPKVVNNRNPAVQQALASTPNAGPPPAPTAQGGPGSPIPTPGTAQGGPGSPIPTPGTAEGLKIKSAEAIGGGATASQVFDVARYLQDNTAGGVKHFAAFNDRFHQNHKPNSLHTRGMAGDATFNDPSQYAVMAQQLRSKFAAAGLTPKDYEVIDHNAKGDAPPHLHWGFKNQQALAKYQAFQDKQNAMAQRAKATATPNIAPQSLGPQIPPNLNGSAQLPQQMASAAPQPGPIQMAMAGAEAGGGSTTNVQSSPQVAIHINGGGQDPRTIGLEVQRRMNEIFQRRVHDVEPDTV